MSKPFLSVEGWFFVISCRGSQEGLVFSDEVLCNGSDTIECSVGDRSAAEQAARDLAAANPGVRYYVAESVAGFLGTVEVEKVAA